MPDSTVSNNQFSSVSLNELAMNARKRAFIISSFREAVNPKTDISLKGEGVKIAQSSLKEQHQIIVVWS